MAVASPRVRSRSIALGLLGLALMSLSACGLTLGDHHTLSDRWEFRRGFEDSWLREPPGTWPAISLPRLITRKDGIRTGWVVVRQEVPANVLNRWPRDKSLAVNPGWLSDVVVIYWNDRLVGQTGSVTPYVPGFQRHAIYEVPAGFLRREGPNVLAIALFSNGAYALEVLDPVRLGPVESIHREHLAGEALNFTLIGIYLVVGLYHLLLFAKRSVDRHNLHFGIFCVLASLYWFFRIPSRDWLFGELVLWRHKSELIAVFGLGPALLFFLSHLFYGKNSRIAQFMAAYAGVLALVTLVGSRVVADWCLWVWQISALPIMAYIIYFIVRTALRGNRDARYISAGVSLLMVAAIHDILASMGFINNPHLARYSFVVFVVGIAGVLANRFMTVHNSVETLNEELEQKVADRTRRLEDTLSEVRTLKEQQDGDYFLTSLLLEPLGSVEVRSSAVSVRALVRQKKRFLFRKWEAEIGGDLCVADRFALRGRPFVVFVNGDAMGKSIQGAGGALVLGTVFKSLVSRTRNTAMRERYPEQWLKDCFVELQNAFVPFQGSMLLSAVIGLVDEGTGAFYFVNAEQPGLVLLRNTETFFLEDRRQLRKIGVEGLGGVLSVNVAQLQNEDILIVGSDGRDDLVLAVDERGHRTINEDERLFLEVVRLAQGDLGRIERELTARGSLSDDLSLMRIAYREDAQATPPADHENAKVSARRLLADGRAAEAVAAFSSYCDLAPLDTEALRETARAAAQAGQLEVAADFGERFRLRLPDHLDNLVELADTYRRLGNFARTRMLVDLARGFAAEGDRPIPALAEKLILRTDAGDRTQ